MTDPLRPYEPTAQDPFDLRKAGHLLRRAGFGGSLRTRERLARAGVAAAVAEVARASAPTAVDALLDDAVALGEADRIRAYRVLRALDDEAPLRERMSVWWHGHFATSNRKVLDPRAMARQLATFDRLGLSRFDDLCRAMARDPALLRWLDNDLNQKGQPNENFARELLELFTLGRGHYGEEDVREAARAFTGHEVHDGAFVLVAQRHDDGEKVIFGQRGRFVGDDVVALCTERDESATFLARGWLRHFVHPQPDDGDVARLATCYRDNDRDVGRTLTTLLQSRLFFAAGSYRCRIKSPADLVLGLVHGLGARAAPTELAAAMARMGERWLEPPSVEGWHGDRAWLSSATWLLRNNFCADLLALRRGKLHPDPAGLLTRGRTPDERADLAALHLLDGDLDGDSRDRLRRFAARAGDGPAAARAVLHAATALPEYQLL